MPHFSHFLAKLKKQEFNDGAVKSNVVGLANQSLYDDDHEDSKFDGESEEKAVAAQSAAIVLALMD